MAWQRRQMLQVLSLAVGAEFVSRSSQGEISPKPQASPAPLAAQEDHPGTAPGSAKEKVAGIGGLFFRAHDPKLLRAWYQEHLGISVMPSKIDDPVWEQEAGQTVFAPFGEKSDYFGDPEKVWMVNYRVHNLDAMAKQLTDAGIAIKIDPATYPNGRFARLHDPEGNPIELWQPIAPKSKV